MDREALAAFMEHHITSRLGDLNGVAWDNAFKSKRACTVRDFSQYWLQTKDDARQYEGLIPAINDIGADHTYSKLLAELKRKEKVVARLNGMLVLELVQEACSSVFTPKSLVNNYLAVQDCNAELYLRYKSRLDHQHRVRTFRGIHHVLREYAKKLLPAVEEFYIRIEQ